MIMLGANPAQATQIIAGPVIGHVSDTDARIWLQLDTVDTVRVAVYDTDSNQQITYMSMDVGGPSPFIFDGPINGLAADRSYRLEISVGGSVVPLVPAPVVRTAPPPGNVEDVSIAFGSCVDPNARSMKVFDAIAAAQPRAFLFLGNAGYLPRKLDAWPQLKRPAFRKICDTYRDVRTIPQLTALFRSTPVYAVWDEHDFGIDDADSTFVFAGEAQAAFQRYWANPSYGTPDVPGCFCTFSIGDTDVFMLDDRSYRDPASAANRAMLGPAQIAWLEKGLSHSQANVKIIACGCPMLSAGGADGWQLFPTEKNTFLTWLGKAGINGVVLISGSQGDSELTLHKPDGSGAPYPLLELSSHGLTAAPIARQGGPNPERIAGPVGENNFGTIDVTGPRGRRMVTLRLHDANGKARIEQVVPLVDLMPKGS
jgi:alkaline phosphatase D